jgi:hypothetical protein
VRPATLLKVRCWVCNEVSKVPVDTVDLTGPTRAMPAVLSFVCPECGIRSEQIVPEPMFEPICEGLLAAWADRWSVVECAEDLGMAG